MKLIITGFIILGLTGCKLTPPLHQEQLHTLSNDELCRSLGIYNSNGKLVLEIYDELGKRKKTVNSQRCFDLEMKEQHIHSPLTEKELKIRNENLKKNQEQMRLQILEHENQINQLLGIPKRHAIPPPFFHDF